MGNPSKTHKPTHRSTLTSATPVAVRLGAWSLALPFLLASAIPGLPGARAQETDCSDPGAAKPPTCPEWVEQGFPGQPGGHKDLPENTPLERQKRHKPLLPSPVGDLVGSLTPRLCDAASPENRACSVVILHGYNRFNYNGADFAGLKSHLLQAGFSTVDMVGYYAHDCHADHHADDHGVHGPGDDRNHQVWFADPDSHDSFANCGVTDDFHHTVETDYRHLAYHLAWYMFETYSNASQPVSVVAHSMGGLLIRYALAHAAVEGWPPRLDVPHVVTFGTPHDGLSGTCFPSYTRQQEQMADCSPENHWLYAHAAHPDGSGGTDWTVAGSECDAVINLYHPESSYDMPLADHKLYWRDGGSDGQCPDHSSGGGLHPGYMEFDGPRDGHVNYYDQPECFWYRMTGTAPRAYEWATNATKFADW